MNQMWEIWEKNDRAEEAKRIQTPWGQADQNEEIVPGVNFVSTPGHGGLVLSERWWRDIPEDVASTLTDRLYAEEDCEAPIVLALLGLEEGRWLDAAIRIARRLEKYYGAALPHLERIQQEGQAKKETA